MICVHDEKRTDIVRFLRGNPDRVSKTPDSQRTEEKIIVSPLCDGERRAGQRGTHEVLSAFKMTLPAAFVYATFARAASLLPT